MIKENQNLMNKLNIISDAAVAIIAVIMSYFLIFHVLDFEKNYPLIDYIKLSVVFMPVQLVTFGCMGLYGSFRTKQFSVEFGRLVTSFIIDGILMLTMLYIVHIFDFSRWALFIFLLIDLIIVSLKRFVMRTTLRSLRRNGYNKKYILLVGNGSAALEYLKTIREEKTFGLECAGYIGEKGTVDAEWMGGYDSIQSVLDKSSYDEVVCALDNDESGVLPNVVEACELTGTKISVIPVIYKYMSGTPSIDMIGGIPMMNIRRIPLDNIGNAFLKRAMDIIGSLVLIILASPVMLVSAVIIKITMGGKVIFKQKRVGLNKKIFTMYKLKSMRDSDSSDTAWSTDNDPRKTRFGAFIRKLSIDELPQFFNVLKGDMSLVGPRPEIPYYVDSFKDKIPLYMVKHQVKPGITGLAQVNGYRGDTSIEKRIELDVHYIENWSLFLDLSILLRTLFSFINKEKLRPEKKRKYNAEKYFMNNRNKTDMTALAIFFPSVLALAIIPILMRATLVMTDFAETYRYFSGTENNGSYAFIDIFSQCKAFAVVLFAIIMIAMALICCMFLFRRAEKRSLAFVGMSVVYVAMTLASALCSDYHDIAFFGEYDRAEGFYTIACYFVIFLFTMYAFRTTQNFRYVVFALCFCVGVNGLLGIMQFTGNNPVMIDWFKTLITDRDYADQIQLADKDLSTNVYGALYHYNYMGSFTGMVIPLFSVLAVYEKKIAAKVMYILFDALSVFLLFASTARSGIVAVAAAALVGIIVFARIWLKHWKITVSVVAGAAVLIFGANIALGGRLLSRVPSLISDAVGLFLPAEDGTDLFDKLPVREILHNSDGSVSFVTQEDELNVRFVPESNSYAFTDSSGAPVEMTGDETNGFKFPDTRFKDVSIGVLRDNEEGSDTSILNMWFGDRRDQVLSFYVFGGKSLHLIDPKIGDRVEPINAEHFGFEGKELIGSSRGYIWSRTIPLLKNCLIVGYGPDTFTYIFPQNDFLAKGYSYDNIFHMAVDKPHNLYIQIFYSSGLIALLAFIGICAVYLIDSLRLYALRKTYRTEQVYGVSVMLAVVGYLAAGLFNDSIVSVAPVFWILLGTGCALNMINRRLDKNLPAEETEEEYVAPARTLSESEIKNEQKAEELAPELLRKVREEREAQEYARTHVTRDDLSALRERISRMGSSGSDGKDGENDSDSGDD